MSGDRNVQSVLALLNLLRRVVEHPEEFHSDVEMREMLSSQGALAAFERAGKGIWGMSLNTQKKATEVAAGSYKVLNELRKRARTALSNEDARQAPVREATKKGLAEEVLRLKGEMRLLEQDLSRLTLALTRVSELAVSLAKDVGTQEAQVYCKKELRTIHLSLAAGREFLVEAATNVAHIRPPHARP